MKSFVSPDQCDANRPCDQTNLVLNSIEKVKPGSLLSLMCMSPESNGIKF